MPLDLPSEVDTMLGTGSINAHNTLDIEFGDTAGTIIHFSTKALVSVPTTAYGSITYVNKFRTTGSLDQALTVSVDRVDLSFENIDLVLGDVIMNDANALNGATGILSTVFVDGATKKQVEILHGEICNASSEDELIKFQLVSFLCISGPLGGWRPLMKHCAWMYKKEGCNSTDSTPTCSHLFDDPNGCSTKDPAAALTTPVPLNNQDRYGGFIFRTPTIVGSPITDPGGAVDGGNDFNTYVRNRGGSWEGRHVLPQERYVL